MNEEKKLDKDINVRSKLTDEEIVKALECCEKCESCVPCPYFIKKIDCVYNRRAEGDVLDLIHRLQGEVQRLAKVEMEFIGKIADQKAEIERLKDENIEERDIHFKNLCGYKDEIARLKERAKLDLECEKKWGKLMKEQAVKETAKEILRAIGNTPLLDKKRKFGDLTDEEVQVLTPFVNRLLKRIKEIAKEYGVEVEL